MKKINNFFLHNVNSCAYDIVLGYEFTFNNILLILPKKESEFREKRSFLQYLPELPTCYLRHIC